MFGVTLKKFRPPSLFHRNAILWVPIVPHCFALHATNLTVAIDRQNGSFFQCHNHYPSSFNARKFQNFPAFLSITTFFSNITYMNHLFCIIPIESKYFVHKIYFNMFNIIHLVQRINIFIIVAFM